MVLGLKNSQDLPVGRPGEAIGEAKAIVAIEGQDS